MTIRDALKHVTLELEKCGIHGAENEAELLFTTVLCCDRLHLFLNGKDDLADEKCTVVFDMLSQRLNGRPLQYILGSAEFMGIEFYVDENVLIPRPETELLVEQALEELKRLKKAGCATFEHCDHPRVLDLCTGSGAIAVSVAVLAEEADVTATDISKAALDVAMKNAAAAAPDRKIRFMESNLFSSFAEEKDGGLFDLILTNPPYIAAPVIPTLQREVRDYEPRLALSGGPDGLDLIEKIVAAAPTFLSPGALLLMEIGYDQGPAVLKLVASDTRYAPGASILRDAAGLDRLLFARRA